MVRNAVAMAGMSTRQEEAAKASEITCHMPWVERNQGGSGPWDDFLSEPPDHRF